MNPAGFRQRHDASRAVLHDLFIEELSEFLGGNQKLSFADGSLEVLNDLKSLSDFLLKKFILGDIERVSEAVFLNLKQKAPGLDKSALLI